MPRHFTEIKGATCGHHTKYKESGVLSGEYTMHYTIFLIDQWVGRRGFEPLMSPLEIKEVSDKPQGSLKLYMGNNRNRASLFSFSFLIIR